MTCRTARIQGRRASSDDARGHHSADRHDDRGIPVRQPGELGPPGLLVRRQVPVVPHVETLATCLTCRELVVVFTLGDGSMSGWSCDPLDRFAHGSILKLFGIADAVFAQACEGSCRGVEHFSWEPAI